MTIEKKFHNGFTTKNNIKVWINSNLKPDISNVKADTRRLIFCQMFPRKKTGIDNEYELKIRKEIPAILEKCRREYILNTNDMHGEITHLGNQINLENVLSDAYERYQDIFEAHFIVREGDSISRSQMREAVKKDFRSDQDYKPFKAWAIKEFALEERKMPFDGKRTPRILGIALRRPLTDGGINNVTPYTTAA